MLRSLALAAAVAALAVPAGAAPLAFTATRTNLGPPAPVTAGGACGPLLTRTIGAANTNVGTSNLGDFTAVIVECLTAPPPALTPYGPGSGFVFEFASGLLRGTITGAPVGVPGGADFTREYLVTGGTGLFSGAAGTLTGVGTLRFGRTPLALEDITGTLDVAEPGAAGLALFGLAGLAVARRRRKRAVVTARALTVAAAVLAATAAHAAPQSFSGTLNRSNPPGGPFGRCQPEAFTVINNNEAPNFSLGTSNLGDFLNTSSACIVLPPPTTSFDGVFTFDFADGGSIFGTTFSNVTFSATPGVLAIEGFFTITGGTGRFGGATGFFREVGTLVRGGTVAVAIGAFNGFIDVAAPPSAAVFAGAGLLGFAARRIRRA